MSLLSGSALLDKGVCFRDVRLGGVEDVLLDAAGCRVLAIVVLCGDGKRRTLPLTAVELDGARCVAVHSALVLMEESFYRARCRTLTGLMGAQVVCAGEAVGGLADVRFEANGRIARYVAWGPDGEAEVALAVGVTLDAGAPAPAV